MSAAVKKVGFHPLLFQVMKHAMTNHVIWEKSDLENLLKALEHVDGGGAGCIGRQAVSNIDEEFIFQRSGFFARFEITFLESVVTNFISSFMIF